MSKHPPDWKYYKEPQHFPLPFKPMYRTCALDATGDKDKPGYKPGCEVEMEVSERRTQLYCCPEHREEAAKRRVKGKK